MGTEIAISFSALRAQLESEKSSLYKIDENIKKIVQTTGRFSNDRFNNSPGDYLKGGPRLGSRNSYPDSRQNDELYGKRKQETKTVFSRLSARTADSDGEEESKRARVPSAVSRELPSRAAAVRAQAGDAQARTRNRRMFGSLLGTLQKFKQEEIVLQTKEEKKAQVERKIEEQARQLKEKEQQERRTLFADREHKKATIKALEAKMGRVQEFERWEASQKHLGNFILTRAKPHIYWIPKKMTDKATEKLASSRKYHEKCMAKKRVELQEELIRIEQRCLRARGPQAKENEPQDKPRGRERERGEPTDGARKRDKFTNDADVKEDDSDGDDSHMPEVTAKEEPVTDESKMDTTVEQDKTVEQDTTVEQNTTVKQDMTLEQNTTAEQNTTVEQNTTAEQDITAQQDIIMEAEESEKPDKPGESQEPNEESKTSEEVDNSEANQTAAEPMDQDKPHLEHS